MIGRVLHLTQSDQVVTTLGHLGYPAYFAVLLGAWKLAGAIVIAAPGLPRLKEWAYAGFVFDLTAAAVSRAAVGDSTADIVAPLVFLALVLASWALRRRAARSRGRPCAQLPHPPHPRKPRSPAALQISCRTDADRQRGAEGRH